MAGSRRLKSLTDSVAARLALPDSAMVVALSGGADSAVLAWFAAAGPHPVRAVHVHHGWAASDRMQAAAEAVAETVGIGCEVVRVQVPAGASPEGRARAARYTALESARRPGEVVVTGHTLDDQAETILANVLRGSGLDGLRGMPARRDALARPMLDVRRDEARELAVLLALPFRDDPANADLSLRRNYVRHQVLAPLEAAAAPGAAQALARMGDLVDAELAYLDGEAARRSRGRLDVPLLRAIPRPLARRAVRSALVAAGASAVRLADVDALIGLAADGDGYRLPDGTTARRSGLSIEIAATGSLPAVELAWNWVGPARWGRAWTFEGVVRSRAPAAFSLSAWAETFDADAVPSTVMIRPARPDDRIRLRSGTKPTSEALREAGLPTTERPGWPTVVAGSETLWIPGVRRGFTGWVQAGTRRYLSVSAVQEET